MKLALLSLIGTALATPAVMLSHKELTAFEKYTNKQTSNSISAVELDRVARKLMHDCSANTYVVVNQPGLKAKDFQTESAFPFLKKLLERTSTMYTVPYADGGIELGKLANSVAKQCGAVKIDVNLDNNITPLEEYMDTTKRVIEINFEPLPNTYVSRLAALAANDEMLEKIVRATPSPFIALILTSQKGEEGDFETRNPDFKIFPGVTRAKTVPGAKDKYKYHMELQNVPVDEKKLTAEALLKVKTPPTHAPEVRQTGEGELVDDKLLLMIVGSVVAILLSLLVFNGLMAAKPDVVKVDKTDAKVEKAVKKEVQKKERLVNGRVEQLKRETR
ncbi:YALIA101S04e02432g1_1 [Yarrowia lipolytica]|nr:Protein BIG1 [Yarrowia lipolytica]SEI33791.1 YALIA101S04e02432g1_1 [Yarrowia lipolytica]